MAGLSGVSIVYNMITISLMKEENRPYIFVDMIQDEKDLSIVDIIIRNDGKGPAFDVEINVNGPKEENEMIKNGAIFFEISKVSMFNNIIGFMGPNKEYRIKYGRWPSINEYMPIAYSFNVEYIIGIIKVMRTL